MFQLNNQFLQDIGLGSLPEDQKKAFLAHFQEQLEIRVGTRLSEGLTDAQFDEFESFIDRNMEKVHAWLQANAPDYQNDEVYQRLRQNAPETVSDDIVLSEYASLRWLGINRPDYKKTVGQVMEELKQEIVSHRDEILNQAA